MFFSVLPLLHVIVPRFFPYDFILKTATASPPLFTVWGTCPSRQLEAAWRSDMNMRLGFASLLCLLSFARLADCAPPTCYSRALSLGQEIMDLLDKIHAYRLTVSTPIWRPGRLIECRFCACSSLMMFVAENVRWNPAYNLHWCACKFT